MPTNLDRAGWAAAALRHFQSTTGVDDDNALPDLLCDLVHWADREGFNFEDALDTARMHHEAECAEEEANDQQAKLPQPVQNLIAALERQSQIASVIIDCWDCGDLAGVVRDIKESLTLALKTIADVKGGAE
jgi:hypothetical protein